MAVSRLPTSDSTAANGAGVEGLRRRATPNPEQSVPQTSGKRMAEETEDTESEENATKSSDTILYLAYGSNLTSETFRGMRGIRPLSQVNVSVPTLRLTFDLPGFPYKEPCFANVDFREIPKKSQLLDPSTGQPKWDGGVMGVVYEVTRQDYRQIMRTEGGGTGYKEIYVPCIPITKSSNSAPDAPDTFVARTLCCPSAPDDEDPPKHWWQRLTSRTPRPNPGYAQPSLRYLTLLRNGAREHNLPEEYQEYLHSLEPYKITHWRQTIGSFVFIAMAGIPFITFVTVAKRFADENGKFPPFISMIMTALFTVVWGAYDNALKPVFGDGEHTEGEPIQRKSNQEGILGLSDEKEALLAACEE